MASPAESASTLSRYMAQVLSESLELRDGRQVRLRPIRRTDADLLVDLHERLSPESRYFRFFTHRPHLARDLAEYFAGVDFRNRFAIVAVAEEDGADQILGVGRFDLAADEAVAEFALVVRDDYQGVGLGTAVYGRIVDMARARGVRRLTGSVLADNQRMIDLLRAQGISAGAPESGVVQFGVTLDDPPSAFSLLGILARDGDQ